VNDTNTENSLGSESAIPPQAGNLSQSTLRFTKNVSKYFMDFLETDFHKRRIPKRHIRHTDSKGHVIGVSLKKYESAHKLIFENLSKEIALTNKVAIKIGKHKSLLSPAVKNFIDLQIGSITEENCRTVIDQIVTHIEYTAPNYSKKPDEFLAQTVSSTNAVLMEHIVSPIIDTLIKSIGDKLSLESDTALESKNEILDYLLGNIYEEIIPLLNSYLINKELTPVKEYFDIIFSKKNIADKLKNYFEEYTT